MYVSCVYTSCQVLPEGNLDVPMWVICLQLSVSIPHALPPCRRPSHTARQGNNAYIFPGIGLAAVACGATRITDLDMYIAAKALAKTIPQVCSR